MSRVLILLRGSLDSQLVFRSNLIGHLLLTAFYFGMQFAFFSRIFSYADSLRGWTRGEIFILFWAYAILALAVESIATSVNHFFAAVHHGRIEPLLTKPVPAIELVFLRWCQPVSGVLVLVAAVVPLFLGLAPHISVFSLRFTGFVVGIICGVVCNLSVITLLNTATLVVQRQMPVDYIHNEIFKLSLIPTSLYPQRLLMPVLLLLPVACSSAVPAAVLAKGDFRLLGLFCLASAASFVAMMAALRWALLRFDGLGG